jgi:lipoprotein NlpD
MKIKSTFIALCCLVLLLSGCNGNSNYAPVIEGNDAQPGAKNVHIVSRGDTLFSIAWRYNIDFRVLADTNGLRSPYTIFPRQKIYLSTKASGKQSSKSVTTKNASASIRSSSQSATVNSHTPQQNSQSAAQKIDRTRYPFRWQWPVKGKVIRGFMVGPSPHKGIDIKSKIGNSVLAANSGKVVYAGSGLVGYGKLLIIKHDERYLSAYGHNSKLLVTEGQMVKVGQAIAKAGDTGTSEAKLHFEVRLDGKPINPIKLLPKR